MSTLVLGNNSSVSDLPTINSIEPYGGFVYVEVLSAQETLRTKLKLTGSTTVPVNEAYVLAVGPQVPQVYGLEVGHRVFIDGGITFAPNYSDYTWSEDGRKRGMVLYTSIKGRSVE